VGAQCELKTIRAGVGAAMGTQEDIEKEGVDLMEGSLLVMVEPGVYEEKTVVVDGAQRVSIWRCDRESESNKKKMSKVEWRSWDNDTLYCRAAAVSVKSEGYGGGGFGCVGGGEGVTLSLEGCDLTCEGDAAVVQFAQNETTGVMYGCRIHDGKSGGVGIAVGASATLENNNIHSTSEAVLVVYEEGSKVVIRGNRIHDGKGDGVVIATNACATLLNNTITDNDLAGITVAVHSTSTLTGSTIKGNGQCKVERTEEELATWSEAKLDFHRSPDGFPGVRVLRDCTITMPPGSNTIEGNGKLGSSSREQVTVDEPSSIKR
jgi:parallel beta-helix repeat protein